MFDVLPVHEDFVAEITGIDLAAPPGDDLAAKLRAALDRFAVLVIPGQALDEAEQLRVAKLFGPLETSVGASIYNAKRPRRLDHAELSDISNLNEAGQLLDAGDIRRLINLSNQLWHTDSSFKATPASASLLSAQEVTAVGGATEFADMRAAWDALAPELQQQTADLVAIHDYFYSRSLTGFDLDGIPPEWRQMQPPVRQVLVRRHPATGRRTSPRTSAASRGSTTRRRVTCSTG